MMPLLEQQTQVAVVAVHQVMLVHVQALQVGQVLLLLDTKVQHKKLLAAQLLAQAVITTTHSQHLEHLLFKGKNGVKHSFQ
jgi:uncharacterized SAM-binding protein YcdF (DUF218 family)